MGGEAKFGAAKAVMSTPAPNGEISAVGTFGTVGKLNSDAAPENASPVGKAGTDGTDAAGAPNENALSADGSNPMGPVCIVLGVNAIWALFIREYGQLDANRMVKTAN